MVFNIKDLDKDVLCITVFDRDFFSPNGKFISHPLIHSNQFFLYYVKLHEATVKKYSRDIIL